MSEETLVNLLDTAGSMFASYLQAIIDSLGPVRPFLSMGSLFFPTFIACFVVIGLIVYFVRDKGERTFSLKEGLKFIFPASIYRNKSSFVDYWVYFINSILGRGVPNFAFLVTLIFSGETFRIFLLHQFGEPAVTLPNGWYTRLLHYAIFALALDFIEFFMHWLFHKVPAFWRLHRAHHSAEVLSPVTALRNHPLELLFLAPCFSLFLGVTTGTFMYFATQPLDLYLIAGVSAVTFARNIFGNFRHSHIWISFGKPLSYLIVSPCMHQIHHSALPKHRDKNLGGMFAFWDWMFGTLYIPKEKEEFPLGISLEDRGDKNPHRSTGRFYVEPVTEFFRVLAGGATPERARSAR